MWVDPKDFLELQKTVKALNEELQRLSKLAYVVDFHRDGLKMNITFYQDGKLYKIEAVEVISGGKDTDTPEEN